MLKVEEESPSTRSLSIVEEFVRLAETGRGNDLLSIRGTYWIAYNGVSEWLTYNRGRSENNRLNSLWFGDGLNTNRYAPGSGPGYGGVTARRDSLSGTDPAGRLSFRQLREPSC